MKRKSLIGLCIVVSAFGSLKAQTWNLGGNSVSATGKLGTTTAFGLQFLTNNATRMTITGTGKVGIGTASPTSFLHLQKTSLTDLLVKSTANGAEIAIDRSANGFEAVLRYAQTGVTQWKTGLTVNSTGSPDYVVFNSVLGSTALTVSGGTNFFRVNSGYMMLGNTNESVIKSNGNDLELLAYSPSAGTPGNLFLQKPQGLFNTGNVAIGTADASLAKFTVQGAVGQSIAMFRKSATSAGISIAADWPEIYYNSYYNGGVKAMKAGFGALIGMDPTTGLLYFRTSSTAAGSNNGALTLTNRMTIGPDGKVLINNATANSTFNATKIAGTDDAGSFLGTQYYSHFMFGANENTYIRGGKDASVVILADLGTQMVGIGTANPAYKLDVCGTIRAKEVRVATGWCDFVFADDYNLKPLSEVENYIKEHKHLPDVTPGPQIESEGLEVGKTSAEMIRKIEELTLYIIEQNKKLEQLSIELEKLKNN